MDIDPAVRFVWEGRWGAGAGEPPRLLYDCELVLVSAGAFELTLGRRRHHLHAGMLAVIPPGLSHASRVPESGSVVRHCVHFDWQRGDRRPAPLFAWQGGDGFDPALVHVPPAAIAALLPLVRDLSGEPGVREALDLALRQLRRGDAMAPVQLGAVLRWLVAPPPAPPPAHRRRARERIVATMHHIDRHSANPIGHAELRRISGLGPSQLCAGFRLLAGCRPLVYLQQVRIRHAERLLCATDASVGEIARAVGIPDPGYFARVFRRHAGCTPQECRLRGRPWIGPPVVIPRWR